MRSKRMSGIGFFARGLGLAVLAAAVLVSAHHATAPPAPDWSPLHDERLQVASAEHPLAAAALAWGNLKSQPAAAPESYVVPAALSPLQRALLPIDRARLTRDEGSTRLTHSIQVELQRVGCYHGRSHGTWDEPTHTAMTTFMQGVGSPMPVTGPQYAMLTLLQGRAVTAGASPCAVRDRSPSQATTVALPDMITVSRANAAAPIGPEVASAAERSETASPVPAQSLTIIAPPPSTVLANGPDGPLLSVVTMPGARASPISTAELKQGELQLDRAIVDAPSLTTAAGRLPRIDEPSRTQQVPQTTKPAQQVTEKKPSWMQFNDRQSGP